MRPALAVQRIGPERDSFAEALRLLAAYRSLLSVVTRRELRLRYKQTALGVAWAVIHPLTLMLVLTAVFSRIVHLDSEGVPYPLFAYAALLPWTFVSTATTLSMQSLVKDVELVTRIWFPREILPVGSVLASLFDFAVALVLFLVLLVAYGNPPGWTLVFVVPLVLVQMLLVLGLALFNSALNVRYRDVKFIVPLGIQLWMFASPIIYSVKSVPESMLALYRLNPVVGLVDGFREVLLHHRVPDLSLFVTAATVSLAIFVCGWWYFRRVEIYFADVI